MPNHQTPIRVAAADPNRGDLIVHFFDGTSVLYRAHFLYDVRADDGNVALPDTPETDAESE